MYSKKTQWMIFGLVNGLLLLVLLLFPFYQKLMDAIPESKCAAVVFLNTYCPACGGTRAFNALIHLDIISSFKYNPVVPLGAAGLIYYEIAMIVHLIKGKPRDILFKTRVIFAFLGFWFVYSLVRCILLYFGIDLLGDIL